MFILETRPSLYMWVTGDERVEEAQFQSSAGIYLGVSQQHFPQGNTYQEIEKNQVCRIEGLNNVGKRKGGSGDTGVHVSAPGSLTA